MRESQAFYNHAFWVCTFLESVVTNHDYCRQRVVSNRVFRTEGVVSLKDVVINYAFLINFFNIFK